MTKSTHRLTIIAIAIIAYAGVNISHEIIGHCGMALVMGTKCKVISSTYIPLAIELPTWKYNILLVSGVTANWIVGLSCLLLLRKAQPASSAARYFLWLLMSANLFLASTYIAVAPIIKFGDSYILIQDRPGQFFWRSAVALVGAVLWWISFQLSRKELGRLVGFGGRDARSLALQLVVPAYVAGGIVTVMSALFSQLEWKVAQLEAAGGTFGLTIWLLLLPFFIPEQKPSQAISARPPVIALRNPFVLPRSVGWILAGALAALVFVGVLGRGISL